MKQMKSVKKAGPYHITSHSQGRGIVYFQVYPAFPEYDGRRESPEFLWAESRFGGEGGGPSIFTSIATARVLEDFLNQVYHPDQVASWKERIGTILEVEGAAWEIAECPTCGIVTSIKKEYVYCPVCGNKYKK